MCWYRQSCQERREPSRVGAASASSQSRTPGYEPRTTGCLPVLESTDDPPLVQCKSDSLLGRRRTGRGAGVHANPEPRVTSPGLWDVFPSWKTQTTPPSCNANRMPCWGAGVRKGAQAYVKGRGRTGRGAGVHANPEPRVTSPGLWDVFPSWKTPTTPPLVQCKSDALLGRGRT